MTELADGYDVVCVGGAVIGSAAAYFLSESADFDGTVLVVEPDSTYEFAQTSRAQNSIREQFSNPINIQISQFGMDFMANFHENVRVDGQSPRLNFRGTGYMFVAKSDAAMNNLSSTRETQLRYGADVKMLSPEDIAKKFPYMNVEGIVGARLGSKREGSFDGWSLLQGYRQRAVHNGVTYLQDRVVGLDVSNGRVVRVQLASGRSVGCGHVINSAGSRAKLIAAMVGLDIPVEPRARSSFVFDCRTPILGDMPLTILPEGVHFRREQHHYMCGTQPRNDVAIDYDDWDLRPDEFEEQIWPVLAGYVPHFDRISLVSSWGGQYAFNVLDHNVVLGAGSEVTNFLFANGFSGHGLQQSAAVGRGLSELIAYGEFRTLDMSELGFDRVVRNEPFLETAVI